MQTFKTYLIILLLALPLYGGAQINSENIPSSFKLYEFYSDATLKTIYQTKNDIPHGFAIEFYSNGKPSGIGKYKNNIKKGKWLYADCKIIYYEKTGQEIHTPPYCGISDFPLSKKFNKLVNKQLDQ